MATRYKILSEKDYDIAIANGGTGQSTAQAAINALTAVAGATAEHVLTKDTATGNAIFKASISAITEHTATLTCTSGGYTLSSDKLYYIRIGRMLILSGRIVISGASSPSGGLKLSLPVEVQSGYDGGVGTAVLGGAGAALPIAALPVGGESYATFINSSTGDAIINSDVDTAFILYITVIYFTV